MKSIKHYLNRYREKLNHQIWDSRLTQIAKTSSQALEALRNSHRGQRAFLIGNGPSINEQNLNLLKHECTFACNSFFLKGEEIGLTPTYYVVEDKFVAEDNSEKINSLKGSTKLIPNDLSYCLSSNDQINVNFLRYYLKSSNPQFPLFWNAQNPDTFYWGGTVMYLCIQLAVYMGFDPLYLIGIDLSYKIPTNIQQEGDKLTSLEDDSNHFHPDYFGKGKRWHLPETDRMQHCFEKAFKECSAAGVSLFNSTHGGNLAVIPRAEYTALF